MASDIYTNGSSNINGAMGAGKDAISSFNPNDWQQQTQKGYDSMFANQQQGQNDYISAFKNQILNQPSATDYYNKGMDAFGVQGLQKTSNDLNNAMLNTPNSNIQAARGFNFDANQIAQKDSQDLQRLAPAAAAAQNNASTAQGNAMNYANNGIQQNNMNLIPYQTQGQMLTDLYARQSTGYGQQQEAQLTALTQKMAQGVALSQSEMQAYSQLSTAEASYQSAKATADAQVKQAQLNNNFHVLNPSQGLYSANTGGITPYNSGGKLPAGAATY